MPGLIKLAVVKKPATNKREGINPMTFPVKPASENVRAKDLKVLKDLVP